MKMSRIDIPPAYQRNSPNVIAVGIENTGTLLVERGNEMLGIADLAGKDVLDVGCGTRFTQTFINRKLPLGSYTGIDVLPAMIEFLTDNVLDERFSYHYWPVYNAMYNTAAKPLSRRSALPLASARKFDVIWMYSVITHNYPRDTAHLFHILRRYIRQDGGLLFSAFIDNSLAEFDDRVKDQPLLNAFFNEAYLRRIVEDAGWRMGSAYDRWPHAPMQNLYLCRPRRRWWSLF